MPSLCNRLLRRCLARRDGAAAVEMALVTPLLVLMLVGFFDYGSYLADASTVEKAVRAGASLAAHSAQPVTGDALTRVTNLVKTGKVESGGTLLVTGWSDGAATLTVTTRNATVSGQVVQVVRVEASVPYKSVAQGLLEAVGLSVPTIAATHEQAYVGA